MNHGFIRRLLFILFTSNGSISRALNRSTLKYPGLKHEAIPGFPHAQHCLSTRNHPLLGADATFCPQMLGADALFCSKKKALFLRVISRRESVCFRFLDSAHGASPARVRTES